MPKKWSFIAMAALARIANSLPSSFAMQVCPRRASTSTQAASRSGNPMVARWRRARAGAANCSSRRHDLGPCPSEGARRPPPRESASGTWGRGVRAPAYMNSDQQSRSPAFAAFAILARFILGALFIYMGLQKALHPVEFLKLVRQYDALHSALALNLVASALPWFEI